MIESPDGRTRSSLLACSALAVAVVAGACTGSGEPRPAPSPTPDRSPVANPSPTPAPRPSAASVAPTPRPSPATPSPAPAPRTDGRPAPDGGAPLGPDAARAWERGRTALVVDIVVRAKSFERGWEAVVPFVPDMRQDATVAFLACEQDPDARVRERCLQALAEMARFRLIPDDLRPRVIESVTQRVRGEANQPAWAAAVRALGAIAGVDAGKEVTDALARAVDDDAGMVVRACADVLADLGHRPAALALVQAADRVRDHYALRSLVRALGRVGGPEATERLKRVLDSSDAGDREAAATALGEASGKEAAAALRATILKRGEEPTVRRAAIAALERMGGADARQALEGCLADLQDRKEDVWVGVAQDVSDTLERVKRR